MIVGSECEVIHIKKFQLLLEFGYFVMKDLAWASWQLRQKSKSAFLLFAEFRDLFPSACLPKNRENKLPTVKDSINQAWESSACTMSLFVCLFL